MDDVRKSRRWGLVSSCRLDPKGMSPLAIYTGSADGISILGGAEPQHHGWWRHREKTQLFVLFGTPPMSAI